MGRVRIESTTPGNVLEQYPIGGAKPDKLYTLTLRGGKQGPFAVTRLQDGRVAFLLQPPLTPEDVDLVTELPSVRRIAATDGAALDNPTPLQAFEFLHHHVKADVTIYL